jgi:hypothetical protein
MIKASLFFNRNNHFLNQSWQMFLNKNTNTVEKMKRKTCSSFITHNIFILIHRSNTFKNSIVYTFRLHILNQCTKSANKMTFTMSLTRHMDSSLLLTNQPFLKSFKNVYEHSQTFPLLN